MDTILIWLIAIPIWVALAFVGVALFGRTDDDPR